MFVNTKIYLKGEEKQTENSKRKEPLNKRFLWVYKRILMGFLRFKLENR